MDNLGWDSKERIDLLAVAKEELKDEAEILQEEKQQLVEELEKNNKKLEKQNKKAKAFFGKFKDKSSKESLLEKKLLITIKIQDFLRKEKEFLLERKAIIKDTIKTAIQADKSIYKQYEERKNLTQELNKKYDQLHYENNLLKNEKNDLVDHHNFLTRKAIFLQEQNRQLRNQLDFHQKEQENDFDYELH